MKYYKEAIHGVYLSNEEKPQAKRSEDHYSQVAEKSIVLGNGEVKSRNRGGGRCCICFDPFSFQNISDSVVVFFCCHAYHATCLMDSTDTSSSNKEIESINGKAEHYEYNSYVDEEEESEINNHPMRCILCTTASS